jgi:hypothetical protein
MAGNEQYELRSDQLCPSAGDYAFAITFAIFPLEWAPAGIISLGHLINEGHIYFTLKISVPGCQRQLD